MTLDLPLAIGGLLVGVIVGLTGMGGGALMTPMMILLFGVQPLAAVSSDLVASLVMKPVGGAVHLRRGTVNRGLVKWLVIGSVPSAFAGVLVLRAIGGGENTANVVKISLGVALLFAAGAMIAKALLDLRKSQRLRYTAGDGPVPETRVESVVARPIPTLLLYPTIRAGQLVGTDLVQAVPLVASASLGHLLFGDFQLGLTASLLVGALPGVYVGARVSSSAPGGIVRRALVVVLLASALKLLGASTTTLVVVLAVVAVVGPVLWATVYRAARPDLTGTTTRQWMGAAVTGRWLRRRDARRARRADRATPVDR